MASFNPLQFLFGTNKPKPEQETYNTAVVQRSTSGASGTQIFGGVYDEEYIHNLKGMERAKEFDKVRKDYCMTMLLRAVKSPILGAIREISCADEENVEYKKHEEFIEKILLSGDYVDMDDYLQDSLKMCDFGYALFENSHTPIMEPVFDEEGVKILDSFITLNQPEWRDPKTIFRWNFDRDTKKLSTVSQQANGDLGAFVEMNAEFLSVITLNREGQNLEGESLLRPCYGPWMRKNVYLKLNAINIEKSQPIPTAVIPVGKENTPEFETLIETLQAFTSHEQNYLTSPVGWELNLSNGTAYDPSKLEVSIDNEDKRACMAFLANFLLLGSSGKGGSYSLADSQADFFLDCLMYIVKLIEKNIDKDIKKLIILNFGKQEKYPKFKISGITDRAGREFGELLKSLADAKVIIPDNELEESVRKRIGLPKISVEGQREVTPTTSNSPSPISHAENSMSLSERIGALIKSRK